MSRSFLPQLLVIAAGALALRLPQLTVRPFHGDEAIHAYKLGERLQTGKYVYDRTEYHGPVLNDLTLPILWLTGKDYRTATEFHYRLVPVLAGTGLVLLLWLVREYLGRWESAIAGILTAISPAMVFYSRYYIQEMLLVFFAFLGIAAGWRYAISGKAGWAILAGLSLGMMHATKETWIIAFAAMTAAAAASCFWASRVERRAVDLRPLRRWGVVLGAIAGGIAVAFVFLSGFFTNLRGPWDSILAYGTYLDRGTGHSQHVHPWYFYLHLLTWWQVGRSPVWTEAMIVGLAAVGLAATLVRRPGQLSVAGRPEPLAGRFHVFLAVYTLLLTAGYSALPYKTPWCMLGFLHGMILLAGVGAAALARWMSRWPLKTLVVLCLLGGMGQLLWQAFRTNFSYHWHGRQQTWFCDYRNPWVYSHPGLNIFSLLKRIEELARVSPDGADLLMKAVTIDIWPLPWYLRNYPNVGYYPDVPEDPDAPVIITSSLLSERLGKRLKNAYQVDFYGLRRGVVLEVYVRQDLWEAFLRSRGIK